MVEINLFDKDNTDFRGTIQTERFGTPFLVFDTKPVKSSNTDFPIITGNFYRIGYDNFELDRQYLRNAHEDVDAGTSANGQLLYASVIYYMAETESHKTGRANTFSGTMVGIGASVAYAKASGTVKFVESTGELRSCEIDGHSLDFSVMGEYPITDNFTLGMSIQFSGLGGRTKSGDEYALNQYIFKIGYKKDF